MTRTPACVWPLECVLGEGPVWRADEQALWFTDIKRRQIHRFEPATGGRRSWDAPDQPGWVQKTHDGRWIAGLKTGLHWFEPATGAFVPFVDPEPERPDNRLNDSCVDAQGRLWFGTMDDGEAEPSGRLYRLAAGPKALPMGGECVITNGPAFAPDGRTLYHVDTLARQIWAYDLSAAGDLTERRLFLELGPDEGYPDGPAVDAEGCVWISLFAGWGVRRYSPAGELLETVAFPVANVTKIAFGGADFRTAYATTASKGLNDDERKAQPLAGGLFAFRVDVPGLPSCALSEGL